MRYPYEDYDHLPTVGTGRRTTLTSSVRDSSRFVKDGGRPAEYWRGYGDDTDEEIISEAIRDASVRPKLVERIPRPDDYDRATDRSDRELDALRDAELDDWFGRYDA